MSSIARRRRSKTDCPTATAVKFTIDIILNTVNYERVQNYRDLIAFVGSDIAETIAEGYSAREDCVSARGINVISPASDPGRAYLLSRGQSGRPCSHLSPSRLSGLPTISASLSRRDVPPPLLRAVSETNRTSIHDQSAKGHRP